MTNLLTMFPVVFLLFAGLVDGSTVKFQATPASLEPLVTKNLTLVCSLQDTPTNDNKRQSDVTDFMFVSSISISLNKVDIATINPHSPATKLGETTGVVSGRFTGKGLDGQLQVSWAYPGDDQLGHYVCLVGGTSKQNRPVTVTKEIDIQKENMNMQQVIGHIEALQQTVDKQIGHIETLQQIVDKQGASLTALTAKARVEPDVFFSALLARGGMTTIKLGQTVIYDKVFTNKGHGYSASSGEFRCPVTGFYTFHLHAFTVLGDYFFLGLKHNGKTVVSVGTATKGHTGTSNTATLKLTQGDVVKVVGTWGTSQLYYSVGGYHAGNTFAGRLISIN